MGNATLGLGTTLSVVVGSGVGSTKTAIADITKITPPKGKTADVDNTILAATAGFKTSQPGLIDAGGADIEGHLIYGQHSESSQQSLLYTAWYNRTLGNYEIAFPSGATLDFSGYVNGFEFGDVTPEGIVTFKASLKINGAPTFTPAAS